jgi:hypothetical protein
MGGCTIIDAGEPAGPTPIGPQFGSPEWRDLFRHALKEAERLGLELSLNPQSGWNLGGPCVKPEEATKHIAWSDIQITGPAKMARTLPMPKHQDKFYRDTFVLAYRLKDGPAGKPHRPISQLEAKAMFHEVAFSNEDCSWLLDDVPAEAGEEDVLAKNVLDLTARFDANTGTLRWSAPAGTWRVLRFGYTTAPERVSCASGLRSGYVVDYFDAAALKSYWRQAVEPLLADAGPLAGKVLKGIQTDSWEGGGINWTARLPGEFRQRRGYDLRQFLPVIAGAIVDSRDASNRFLTDFRKTLGDCMADNHYGALAELASRHGMYIHCEAGGPHGGPFDALKNLGRCDMPMGEFWVQCPHRPTEASRFLMKAAASAAHTYGKRIACGEGFTSQGVPYWSEVPWSLLKPAFDHEACAGLNLVYFHYFACSPAAMGVPGQVYCAGTHFNPNITWANQAHAFVAYLNRCQFLLQQGRFVADVCYYSGDNVPNLVGRKQADPAGVLPGCDYDVFDEEVLLNRMSVKDGRIVLPDGMSYRVMVLPKLRTMSLAALRKIHALVEAGAVVTGPKPEHTASLQDYPQCDAKLRQLADGLWDKGRIISTKTAKEVLASLGVLPDFDAGGTNLDYIHRRDADADIYFVSNPKSESVSAQAIFRVASKQPELWDAVTGQQRIAGAFKRQGDRTLVPLELTPCGSLFVVFRKAVGGDGSGRNFPAYEKSGELIGPWTVSFDPRWGGPPSVQFGDLASWTKRPEDGIRFYSGTATYHKTFDCPAFSGRLMLDLGDVRNLAEVRLNGKKLGVVWTPPFRVDITDAVRPARNALEIDVVNTWYNRLAGDLTLPKERRFTHSVVDLKPDAKPIESGLLGPVRFYVARP